MNGLRLLGLAVGAFVLAAGSAAAQSGGATSWTVGIDSRAFGTVTTRWDGAGKGWGAWTWGAGAQLSVPLFLVVRGGGWDTLAGEVDGVAQWQPGTGWFVRGRMGSGLSFQSQVLGTSTSWTGKVSLEPGFDAGWGELWLVVRPEAALVTVFRPSAYTAATFDDRYEDEDSPAIPGSAVLGLPAVRLLGGLGAEFDVAAGVRLGLILGVYPPLRTGWLGWADGFSFGEIPFFSSLGCRFSL